MRRALLATVFFAHGTPMLLAGDEFGHSQNGNNNAYCQDNETSWLDWSKAASGEGQALIDYVSRLIALRQAAPLLRSRHFLHGKNEPATGILDIEWFDTNGTPLSPDSWNNGG